MQQHHGTLSVRTDGPGCYDISRDVQSFVAESAIQDGLLTLVIQHTSASLTIQENADPDVQTDLIGALARTAPESDHLYQHNAEGPDDMPAHIKSALTDTTLSLPVMNSAMRLGVWQGIYVLEHRQRGHKRSIACHIIGD